MSLVSETTGEVLVNETFRDVRERVVAEVGVVEGQYGLQVAIVQDKDLFNMHVRQQRETGTRVEGELRAHDIHASEAEALSRHRSYARFFAHIGMSSRDVVSNGRRVRVSKMPANSAYLNAALDDIPDHHGFRFNDAGATSEDGEVFLQNIAEGLAPLAEHATQSLFYHDLFQHSIGYFGMSNRKAVLFRRMAGKAVDSGIKRDSFGKLLSGTPAAQVAGLIDNHTFSLHASVRYFDRNVRERARVRLAVPQLRKI